MDKVRVGILGTSWWTDVVWPGFSRVPEVQITAIASRSTDKAEAFAREHGIPHRSGDYDEVIHSPEVDAIFVGVPNFLHHEMAMKALRAGKHVLQEKPMALSVREAQEQADLARDRGLVLMLDQEVRLADGVCDAPQMLRDRIGPLRKVVLGVTMAGGEWGGWRGDKALSGGTLFEIAIHQLDLARWLWSKDPVSVWAMGEDLAGRDMTIVLDFGAGDSAVIDYCWRCIGFRIRGELYGERGYMIQETTPPFGPSRRTVVTEQGMEVEDQEFGVQGPETFRRVMEGFARSILSGAPPPVPAEDGVWAVRMAEAARESLRGGHIVRF